MTRTRVVVLFMIAAYAALLACGCTATKRRHTLLFDVEPDPQMPARSGKALRRAVIETLRARFDDSADAIEIRPAGPTRIKLSFDSSPGDVQRLVIPRGILEFRIVVERSELGGPHNEEAVHRSLLTHGPQKPVRAGGVSARWCEIDATRQVEFFVEDAFTVPYHGKLFVLCFDDPSRAMTRGKSEWRVTADEPYQDPSVRFYCLPFHLDPVGAKRMADLTSRNMRRALCIIVDDKVLSAPVIQSQISDEGTISFGSKEAAGKEAEEMYRLFSAPPLPAILKPVSSEVR